MILTFSNNPKTLSTSPDNIKHTQNLILLAFTPFSLEPNRANFPDNILENPRSPNPKLTKKYNIQNFLPVSFPFLNSLCNQTKANFSPKKKKHLNCLKKQHKTYSLCFFVPPFYSQPNKIGFPGRIGKPNCHFQNNI